jgi:hypothetical protein
MKTQLIIIGIIVIFLTVGLSGCNKTSEPTTLTSIPEINQHWNAYINQTVTIEGTCIGGDDNNTYSIFDTSYNNVYAINSNDVIKPSKLYSGTTYKFTGIIRDNENINELILGKYYLEVTKIETT